MGVLKNPVFWGGMLVMFILMTAFPTLNVRAAGVRASVGRA